MVEARDLNNPRSEEHMPNDIATNSNLVYADLLWKPADTLRGQVCGLNVACRLCRLGVSEAAASK